MGSAFLFVLFASAGLPFAAKRATQVAKILIDDSDETSLLQSSVKTGHSDPKWGPAPVPILNNKAEGPGYYSAWKVPASQENLVDRDWEKYMLSAHNNPLLQATYTREETKPNDSIIGEAPSQAIVSERTLEYNSLTKIDDDFPKIGNGKKELFDYSVQQQDAPDPNRIVANFPERDTPLVR
mmetsp:Transcript_39609/g.62910  ORF Transcript_39609/g.62910 Transcript_39609/m.62910 type:complete len:182 (-) Transcript_39609:292-837(-)